MSRGVFACRKRRIRSASTLRPIYKFPDPTVFGKLAGSRHQGVRNWGQLVIPIISMFAARRPDVSKYKLPYSNSIDRTISNRARVHCRLTAQGDRSQHPWNWATDSRSALQIALEPVDRALERIDLVLAPGEAVAFLRIIDHFGDATPRLDRVRHLRRRYNTVRPHGSLGYQPPAPETATPPLPPSGSAALHLPAAMAAEARMH